MKNTGNNSSFICRPARLSDLDALLALENSAFTGDKLSRRQIRYHLKSDKAKYWVITRAGQPVASLLGFFHKNRAPRLYSIATDAAFRGQGLGENLVLKFLAEAKARGATKAILEVRVGSPAIRLYKKLGFVKTRDLPAYYEDGSNGIKMMVDFKSLK